jgi:hypothetical protein
LDVQLEGKSLGEAYLLGKKSMLSEDAIKTLAVVKGSGKDRLIFMIQMHQVSQMLPPEQRKQFVAEVNEILERYPI